MAKKGIKVKELARDLEVTSRAIIDRCRADGYPVQNSLTKLSPEVEQIIRAWFGDQGSGVRDQGRSPAPGPR